jgi:hypothetical protein
MGAQGRTISRSPALTVRGCLQEFSHLLGLSNIFQDGAVKITGTGMNQVKIKQRTFDKFKVLLKKYFGRGSKAFEMYAIIK